MLTISRLGHRSIKYYNDTANQAKQRRHQTSIAGRRIGRVLLRRRNPHSQLARRRRQAAIAQTTGLDGSALDGGDADTEVARVWLDDGRAPNGATGREFTEKSVHGFDLTFAAPKSVSLIRALDR